VAGTKPHSDNIFEARWSPSYPPVSDPRGYDIIASSTQFTVPPASARMKKNEEDDLPDQGRKKIGYFQNGE